MGNSIAVIGAGVGGMAAAYDLVKAGHHVTIYEKESQPGGLAGGFKDEGWDWSVEKYYHHWFASDHAILGLIQELGWENKVHFYRPQTVVFHNEDFYPLDSPLAALMFPGFSLPDKIRFGLVTAYLRYLSGWKHLEKYTAHEWMQRYYGKRVYQTQFEPLLMGKFSQYYQTVNMAWFWARFKARTPRLGTYEGGFQAFLNEFAEKLKFMGVDFRYNSTIQSIHPAEGNRIEMLADGILSVYDQALATVPPALLARLAPALENPYLQKVTSLKSIGAVVLVMALKHPLSKKGYYWYNLPKKSGFPFLALVEHTNFVSPNHFKGDHIIYCGDYLEPDHEYFGLTKEELIARFMPGIKRINDSFKQDWVRKSWLFRTQYAQPIPEVNHSRNIPAIQTPISNLFFASMSQVYPWDRGTNFAVALARDAARLMVNGIQT
jgi:protoporphyrinogen oxidase